MIQPSGPSGMAHSKPLSGPCSTVQLASCAHATRRTAEPSPSANSGIERLELIFVPCDDLVALQLHCGREHVVLGRPRVGDEAELFGDFEADELGGLACLERRLAHLFDHVRVCTQRIETASDALLLRKRAHRGLVGARERDAEAVRRLGVAHRQVNVRRVLERILHLGERNILALLQLDEVLLAVDDLQLPVWQDLADVARAEVAHAIDRRVLRLVLLDHLRIGLVLVDQVALRDHRPTQQNLATRHADAGLVLVREAVAALSVVAQPHARRGGRRANA
mmetsp:Transcript_8060/g.20747  ORF Transcript_8060/g.20747 Transcript_8060/m.20747 type:complete len:280 (-) Transcript_8060:959-1798(-)